MHEGLFMCIFLYKRLENRTVPIFHQYSSYTDYLNNTGICKNPTMNKIFGDNFDFSSLINLDSNNIFIDIDSPSQLEILEQMDKRIN